MFYARLSCTNVRFKLYKERVSCQPNNNSVAGLTSSSEEAQRLTETTGGAATGTGLSGLSVDMVSKLLASACEVWICSTWPCWDSTMGWPEERHTRRRHYILSSYYRALLDYNHILLYDYTVCYYASDSFCFFCVCMSSHQVFVLMFTLKCLIQCWTSCSRWDSFEPHSPL